MVGLRLDTCCSRVASFSRHLQRYFGTSLLPTILAIDVGTTSMRGVLFDERGSPLASSQVRCAPTYLKEDTVEQDPRTWSGTLVKILRDILASDLVPDVRIDAISLTCQRSSVIPVDRFGEPLHNAMMWQDTRSRDCCAVLAGERRRIYERTGQHLSPVMAAPKIWWFKTHHASIYNHAHKLLTVSDYLVHFLTGSFLTDHTYGSRTLLMRSSNLAWDPELLDLFRIDADKLCHLVSPGSIVGHTNASLAILTGLPSGTPVVSAGGDQQCGALGAGVLNPGDVQITSGTGSYILAPAASATLDDNMRFVCSASAVAGQYLVEASVLTTSVVYGWLGSILMDQGLNSVEMFQRLELEASESAPGASGVLVLPHFQGAGSPDWDPNAKGTFANLTLSTKRADLIRALLEGVAAELADNLDLIRKRLGPFTSISVSGGLSKVALFNDIQADMFEQPVNVLANSESTILGGWASAAVAIGMHASHADALAMVEGKPDLNVVPNSANTSCYLDLRRRRHILYAAMKAADGDYRGSDRE